MNDSLIRAVFKAADSCEAKQFANYLTEDVVFRFGNAPECIGKVSVEENLTGFFSLIKTMSHKLVGIHQSEDVWAVEGVVNYVDNFGRKFSYQVCSVMRLRENKFCEYRIYVDNHDMFIPTASD